MQLFSSSNVLAILVVTTTIIFSCNSSDEELNCTEGYPKIFSNQNVLEYQIDIYHFDIGNLTYARTIILNTNVDDRSITLINQEKLMDTWVQPGNVDYRLENGCIIDYREYQKIQINEDCSLITVNILSVSVNGSVFTPHYSCEDSESKVIQNGINFFLESENFDSVYVEKYKVELNLVR